MNTRIDFTAIDNRIHELEIMKDAVMNTVSENSKNETIIALSGQMKLLIDKLEDTSRPYRQRRKYVQPIHDLCISIRCVNELLVTSSAKSV